MPTGTMATITVTTYTSTSNTSAFDTMATDILTTDTSATDTSTTTDASATDTSTTNTVTTDTSTIKTDVPGHLAATLSQTRGHLRFPEVRIGKHDTEVSLYDIAFNFFATLLAPSERHAVCSQRNTNEQKTLQRMTGVLISNTETKKMPGVWRRKGDGERAHQNGVE
ncbi:uncharacterized [Tachysurus ichikawai]